MAFLIYRHEIWFTQINLHVLSNTIFLNYKVSKIHSSGDVLFMAYTSGPQRFSVPVPPGRKKKTCAPLCEFGEGLLGHFHW